MALRTSNLLQEQIKKVQEEKKQIRKDLAAHEQQVKALNSRLKDVVLTVQQLKSFTQQLKKDGGVQLPSKRGAEDMEDTEDEGSGNAIVNSFKVPRFSHPQHQYQSTAFNSHDFEDGDRTEKISNAFGLEILIYTSKQWEFMNKWLRQNQADPKSKKLEYMSQLTSAFNEHFDQNRTVCAISTCAQRIRGSGHLHGSIPDYTKKANTPLALSKLTSVPRRAETPLPFVGLNALVGLATPPTSPEKLEEISTEFLDECGVIVSVGEENWFELRCHLCGRNSTTNGKFFQGWEGVCRHLMQVHTGLDLMGDEEDFDFVMRKCVLRRVSAKEVEEIEKGQVQIEKIKKANPRADGASLFESMKHVSAEHITHLNAPSKDTNEASEFCVDAYECSGCGTASKVNDMPEICYLCGWAVCTACYGVGSLLEGRPSHMCTGAKPMDTDSSTCATPAASELGRVNSRFAATQLAAPLLMLDDFCPCTLSGHACKAVICKKKELCLEKFHGLHCIHNCHEIKPSCPSVMDPGHSCDSPPFRCAYEHNDVEGHRLSIAIYHDCEVFEH